MRLVFGILVLVLMACKVWANDSTAVMAVGGLVLTKSSEISLDKEELFLSRDEVRVDYLFTNTSDRDIETLVAFPLPDQLRGEDDERTFRNLKGDLNFTTTVDGRPVTYDVVEQALSKGADITARIVGLGLPVNPVSEDGGLGKPAEVLPEAERQKLIDEELLSAQEYDPGDGPKFRYYAGWDYRLTVTRKQVFPAGKTVAVSHRYKPLAGGSVGGNFDVRYRKEDFVKEKIARFCVDKAWLAAFDKKRRLLKGPEPSQFYSEVWLGYVLKSGANWKGPIKDFRLVVDKGKASSLVSFCGKGVKKISDTQFEMRKSNFEPKEDLNVLILEWGTGE
jgi:Domain of unknown function (DUF4424)